MTDYESDNSLGVPPLEETNGFQEYEYQEELKEIEEIKR